MTNEARRDRIKTIKEELDVLLKSCPHNIIKVGSSAKCDICNRYFGWYCPESPNHACDYEQEDGEYNEDDCIYCHEPEERK